MRWGYDNKHITGYPRSCEQKVLRKDLQSRWDDRVSTEAETKLQNGAASGNAMKLVDAVGTRADYYADDFEDLRSIIDAPGTCEIKLPHAQLPLLLPRTLQMPFTSICASSLSIRDHHPHPHKLHVIREFNSLAGDISKAEKLVFAIKERLIYVMEGWESPTQDFTTVSGVR